MADIHFPSVIIFTGEWALLPYDLFAISRVPNSSEDAFVLW